METSVVAFFNSANAISNFIMHVVALLILIVLYRRLRLTFLTILIAGDAMCLAHWGFRCWMHLVQDAVPWVVQLRLSYVLYTGGTLVILVGLIFCLDYLLKGIANAKPVVER